MSENQLDLNEQVVVAFFDSAEAADTAADALMKWDKASEEIKLGSIGRVIVSSEGKVESKSYGHSRGRKGALIGGAVGLIAGVFTGGLSLLGGALVGGALGGATGAATKGSLGLSNAAMEDVKQHLQPGGAALVVLCDDHEVDATMHELENVGGKPRSYGVSAKVLNALSENKIQQQHDQIQAVGSEMYSTSGPVS
jgi:uncharacterized membrane protein